MAAKKKNKGGTRRRRRSAPAKVTRRRSRRSRGGFGNSSWLPLALALFAGDVAASTLLAKLPAIVSPEAVVLYAAGYFLNKPAFKELALPMQAAHVLKMVGKEQAVKMLAGINLGAFSGGTRTKTASGSPMNTVEEAANSGLQVAEVGNSLFQEGQQIAAEFA